MPTLLVAAHAGFEQFSFLEKRGLKVLEAGSHQQVYDTLTTQTIETVLVDLESFGHGSLHLLQRLAQSHPTIHCVAMVDPTDLGRVSLDSIPACSVILKPTSRQRVLGILEHVRHVSLAAGSSKPKFLIGISSGIRKLRQSVAALGEWTRPVLITGETGTGKEMVAQCLHLASTSRKGPLITVDCGAVSPTLLENELFGHAKGAYTGAVCAQKGLIQAADGGTLFFDEIGDLPLECQSRLLRVIQEREVRPLGDTHAIQIDLRICAATNVDLPAAVNQKRFREDLYYRLSAVSIQVPPLRDRREDIPLLASHFLRHLKTKQRLSINAHLRMMEYSWPGNVRELENRLMRASTLAERNVLTGDDVVEEKQRAACDSTGDEPGTLRELEKEAILRVVNETNRDIVTAARRLGIGRTTLYRRLKAYGL
jgi:DNA-binding NtrC family response regulator